MCRMQSSSSARLPLWFKSFLTWIITKVSVTDLPVPALSLNILFDTQDQSVEHKQLRSGHFSAQKSSRLSPQAQRKGQSSCSGLESCLFSHLELWPQLLPPTPSSPMPATPASLCLNSPVTLLPNLPLLFPLPRTLFPRVSAWLTLWVPLGVCSKVTWLVTGHLALGYCLSSCDILLGVDTPTLGLCLPGFLVWGLQLPGFSRWEAGEECENVERAELSPPLSASGSVLVADINVSLLWPQAGLGENYLWLWWYL